MPIRVILIQRDREPKVRLVEQVTRVRLTVRQIKVKISGGGA
jgi:hypothetical protein